MRRLFMTLCRFLKTKNARFCRVKISHWSILIGPEGGFTPEELTAAEAAGCRRASLAPHILRVETAAIAVAAGMAAASAAPRA